MHAGLIALFLSQAPPTAGQGIAITSFTVNAVACVDECIGQDLIYTITNSNSYSVCLPQDYTDSYIYASVIFQDKHGEHIEPTINTMWAKGERISPEQYRQRLNVGPKIAVLPNTVKTMRVRLLNLYALPLQTTVATLYLTIFPCNLANLTETDEREGTVSLSRSTEVVFDEVSISK